jgi:hypothetical protein
MTGSGERPEETGQSVNARQLREQLTEQLAAKYPHRPLRRWLLVEMGRNDMVFVGIAVVWLMFLLILYCGAIQSLKYALEGWHLHRVGIPTQAYVLVVTDRGRSLRTQYIFEAATGDGGTESFIKEERVVTRKAYESLVVGEEVSIVYDPANPSLSRIKGNGSYNADIALSPVLACILVPTTILMIVLPLNALRKRIVQWVRG